MFQFDNNSSPPPSSSSIPPTISSNPASKKSQKQEKKDDKAVKVNELALQTPLNHPQSSSAKSPKIVTVGKESIVIEHQGQQVSIERKAKEEVSIPHNAENVLRDWLVQKNIDPTVQTGNRVVYPLDSISTALEQFKNLYGCNWHLMKKECSDTHLLQIINDLRSAYLSIIFNELKNEFPQLIINDFGSTKLTSDRDFSFQLNSSEQAKESLVVTKFNEKFEAIWKCPSATVFDSNAYTMQYVLDAVDPHMESKRAQLQQEGSLLMKLRTSTPESWDHFKKSTLENLKNDQQRQQKLREFQKVENKNRELQFILNKSIATRTFHQELSITPPVNPQTFVLPSPETQEKYSQAALQIRSSNEAIEIQVSNSLHETLKSSSEFQEGLRIEIFLTLETLDSITDPDEFAKLFNETHYSLIESYTFLLSQETNTQKKEALSYKIENLKSSIIEPDQNSSVMQAYKERRLLENKEKALLQKRRQLESTVLQLHQLKDKASGDFDELVKLTDLTRNVTVDTLNIIDRKAQDASRKIEALKAQYNVKTVKEIENIIQKDIQQLNKELIQIQSTIEQKAGPSGYGEFWRKAGSLGLESDRLLVQIQENNLQGMCFAQEAHVSEGAFSFVVLNLQAGSIDVRTPAQYVQAFREISGFFSGHQAHHTTPHSQMIEASKYAERLIIVFDNLKKRAQIMQLQPPQGSVTVNHLRLFFKEISSLRGAGLADRELQEKAEAAAQKIFHKPLNDALVESINASFDEVSGYLEAWLFLLPTDAQNAYFKTKTN